MRALVLTDGGARFVTDSPRPLRGSQGPADTLGARREGWTGSRDRSVASTGQRTPYNLFVIRTLTTWELWLLGSFVLVVGRELVSLLLARRRGLTQNVSRVVTFSLLLALAVLYGVVELPWLQFDEGAVGMNALRRLPTANWGYLVLGVMIALVLAYEASALVEARRAGLTREVFRLVALFSAGVLLLVLLGISQAKWGLYLEELDSVYSESLLPDGG